ncbi:MAG: M20/M25/M40 family metallo-hydrolase [Clostridia bacterium]|nr:M20/M25/M40 family metallo-hydrolase [Clostridia bacterium]
MNNFAELSAMLEALCSAKGVSGAENEAAAVASQMLEKYMPVSVDALGSVTGRKEGRGAHILLDAHLDQIGLIVTAVDEIGFLKFAKCGGADRRVLAAAEVTVHGKEKLFGAVISTPPHLAKPEEASKALPFDEMAIDIGMTKEEAEKLVSPGARVTFNGGYLRLMGNRIRSPSVDDRAGVAAVLRCLEILEEKNVDCNLSVMFSSQEETGGSGAQTASFAAQPDEAIAVDVSFASAPGVSSEKYASLGKGTMIGFAPSLDYKMSKTLETIANRENIPYQPEVMGGKTGTNCDEIQVSGKGIKTALLSVPIRNMHTAVEVCDLEDIENTARLMAEYIAERSKENA